MELQNKHMTAAITLAETAAQLGEVPVGAVLVDSTTGEVLAATHNRMLTDRDPTAHAEMQALRIAAASKGEIRLTACDLYVTLEPCPMCAAALALARIRRIYFGAYDPKGGGIEHGPRIFMQPNCNHRPEVYGGISEDICAAQLRAFFAVRR